MVCIKLYTEKGGYFFNPSKFLNTDVSVTSPNRIGRVITVEKVYFHNQVVNMAMVQFRDYHVHVVYPFTPVLHGKSRCYNAEGMSIML